MRRVDAARFTWLESELFASTGARACFSTRNGGYSAGPYSSLNLGLHVGDDEIAVLNNRLDYWSALGLDPDALVGVRQVHGTRVVAVTRADRGKGAASWSHALAGADGLVTLDGGVPVFGLSADCHLVALAVPECKGIAVLHAGWRGLLGGILEKGAGLLAGLAWKQPEDLVAFVGPGLGENCFEVSGDFETSLAAAWGDVAAKELVRSDGTRRLGRYEAAVRRALAAAGILPGNIECIGGCTATESESYYSHRRSGGRTGRMAMTAWVP